VGALRKWREGGDCARGLPTAKSRACAAGEGCAARVGNLLEHSGQSGKSEGGGQSVKSEGGGSLE
jgi:hypothetical protein